MVGLESEKKGYVCAKGGLREKRCMWTAHTRRLSLCISLYVLAILQGRVLSSL